MQKLLTIGWRIESYFHYCLGKVPFIARCNLSPGRIEMGITWQPSALQIVLHGTTKYFEDMRQLLKNE